MTKISEPFEIERLFNKIKQMEIHTPQGKSGILSKNSRYVFNYDQHAADATAVSLVMPVRAESYASGDLMGVFTMNRPEGYLRYIVEEKLKRIGAPSDMFLLFLAGGNQIGRVSYVLPGEERRQYDGEHLSDLLSSPSASLFSRLIDQYALGSGISGVQPKTLVPISNDGNNAPFQHASLPLKTVIVKAEGEDYPNLARNEFFCMSVAKEAGFDVPEFWLSDDGKLFLISRFDRLPDGRALGFEDMTVLTGRTEKQKYEGSYEMIARVVEKFSGEDSAAQLKKLFERVVFSCYVRDGDAHLKNFGMIYDHPNAARILAPIYDVVCTDIYPDLDGKLALKLNKSKAFPTDEDILEYGERLGVGDNEASEILKRIETAYDITLTKCAKDPRYQKDDFLSDIQKAIEPKRSLCCFTQRINHPADTDKPSENASLCPYCNTSPCKCLGSP